jgi:serine/threonine protein kinase/tetratricopeptide (TPR) repeat protein
MQPDDDKTQSVTVLAKGMVIGHYKIVEKIGAGGMGEVYLAEDTELSRKVALKFLATHLLSDPDCVTRFIREAQAAAKLNHPNIVTIHEVSEFNGRPFFAMEHVEGQSLRELIKAKELPIEHVIDLAIQICEGLHKSHQSGVIHRDVKPANILIDIDGRAKILDFGLATVQGCDHLTKTGWTLGTVGYMSPEQAKGEEVDQRSDIFSLGVVLFEMITGKSPFKTNNDVATLRNIIDTEPEPLARYKSRIPDELQRIVSKALVKDRTLRYQHADELKTDLLKVTRELEELETGTAKKQSPTAKPSVAVLYLQNFSENKDDEYFAAGMTEDMITQLSKISSLLVTSRSDVEQFKGKQADIRAIAEKLRVNYVMEGSVRKHGQKIRITCQLIRANDGFHVWAESYDRQLEDIFDVQADIAKTVAKELKLVLFPEELKRIEKKPTENVQAYEYYLQGREYSASGFSTKEGLHLAIKMFGKALEADSNLALAHVGLSGCYASYVMFKVDLKRSWLEKAEEAGLRALSLDPHLPNAYSSLSRLYWIMGKTAQTIQKAEEAVVANPDYEQSWSSLGFWLSLIGEYVRAEDALKRAFELNPAHPSLYGHFIILYSLWGKDERAEEYFRTGSKMLPDDWWTYLRMTEHHMYRGELKEAEKMACKAIDINPRSVPPYLELMEINMLSGNADGAYHFLGEAHRLNPNHDLFIETGYIELMRGSRATAETSYDSCIEYNLPMVREFEDMRDEYYCRSRIALAYALKGESSKALEQAEIVQRKLGKTLLSLEWTVDREIIKLLSFIYSLTGHREDALPLLDFLHENNRISSAFLRLHPFYKRLAGYPPFERLIGQVK